MEIDVKYLIQKLSEDCVPSIKSTISTLEKLLCKAKRRRKDVLGSNCTATTFNMITMTSVGLNPAVGLVISTINLLTHLVDVVLQMKDVKKLETSLSQLCARKERMDVEFENCIEVKEWLQKANGIHEEEEESSVIRGISEIDRGAEDLNKTIKQFNGCKIENLFFDKKIDANDIRAGDHIFRKLNGSPIGYHHGIALGKDEHGTEKVAEFGRNIKREKSEKSFVCQIVDFSTFIGSHEKCYKRHYIGYECKLNETLTMAQEICSGDCQWDTYNLFGNNCEHFATYLKLKKTWSGQTNIGLMMSDWRNIAKLETGIKVLQQELANCESSLNLLRFLEESISVHVGHRRKYNKLIRKSDRVYQV